VARLSHSPSRQRETAGYTATQIKQAGVYVAVYVIGDVQGCYDELQLLLKHIKFKKTQDKLWFAGDLVNRGPKSLEVLRFVRALGQSAVVVLGNHDLHLLAAYYGNTSVKLSKDLRQVLAAPDCDALLSWLVQCPLMHADHSLGYALVHAGLPPQWDIPQALSCAAEVAAELADARRRQLFFAQMYGDQPDHWDTALGGIDRLRFITNALTRLRYCSAEGRFFLDQKGPLGSQSKHAIPWFQVPGRKSANCRLLFGHWSTLGYRHEDSVWALDSGCLWGGSLTALQIDCAEPRAFAVPCDAHRNPQ